MERKSNFRQPSQKEREIALGDLKNLSKRNAEQIKKMIGFFKPVPNPSENDWLSSQHESGQTFDSYAKISRTVDITRKKLYIQPLENGITKDFIEKMQIFARAFFFGMQVEFLPMLDVEKQKAVRQRGKQSTKQYNATDILQILKTIKPQDAYCVIGICLTDIYNRDDWNYVFGLASLTENVGVFSFARYQESFYYPNSKVDEELVIYRSCKVMCHEIVHQFGLKHCIFYHCLMNGSNHYQESGNKPFQLCPVCLRKLQHALKFDMIDRYSALILASKSLSNKYFLNEAFIYKNILYGEDINQLIPDNK